MAKLISYEMLCSILEQNINIITVSQLMRKALELGYDCSTMDNITIAMGYIRQFRIVRSPIFFSYANSKLTLVHHG